jgi:hypothetical protein
MTNSSNVAYRNYGYPHTFYLLHIKFSLCTYQNTFRCLSCKYHCVNRLRYEVQVPCALLCWTQLHQSAGLFELDYTTAQDCLNSITPERRPVRTQLHQSAGLFELNYTRVQACFYKLIKYFNTTTNRRHCKIYFNYSFQKYNKIASQTQCERSSTREHDTETDVTPITETSCSYGQHF